MQVMDPFEVAFTVLADSTRRRILLGFDAGGEPLTVDEVAARVGVHRTVAFAHLERLVAAGYVASEPRRGHRGKPAKLYRPTAQTLQISYPPRRYTELACLLADALAGLGSAGTEAGRSAAVTFAKGLAGDGLLKLAVLGGDYRLLEDGRVHAANCIFREACAYRPALVCGVHAAMLQGALDAADVRPLGPDARGGCTFEVRTGG